MTFFANLEPIITSARAKGNRVFLLTHSMGNWALQAAVENWFAHGNGDALLFDEVFLAAADEIHSSFDFLPNGRLSALDRLGRRVSTYASDKDVVLDIGMKINFAKSLGQDGAHDRSNQERFPPDKYRTVMCGGFSDYAINSPARTSTIAARRACAWTSPTRWRATSDTPSLSRDRQEGVSGAFFDDPAYARLGHMRARQPSTCI